MPKNIFQVEADDIRNYLERHGYTSKQGPDHILVQDPALVVFGGGRRTEYTDVVIRDWPDAIKFVEDRS